MCVKELLISNGASESTSLVVVATYKRVVPEKASQQADAILYCIPTLFIGLAKQKLHYTMVAQHLSV